MVSIAARAPRIGRRVDGRSIPLHPAETVPSRIDHVAFETPDPEATAAFYERLLGARLVSAEGHPVMAYVGPTGFAFHSPGGPGFHVGIRVTDEERARLRPPGGRRNRVGGA